MALTKDLTPSFFSNQNNIYSFEMSPNYCNSCKNLVIEHISYGDSQNIYPSCKAKNLDFPTYLYSNDENKIFRPSECPLLGIKF